MAETAPDDIAGLVEEAAASMYGKNWNSPEADKRPGEKMKDVWRGYAKDALAPILLRLSALSGENKRLRERVRQLAIMANPGDTPAARAERDAVRKSEGPFNDI